MYDFDIQEGEYVGELARRSIGRFDKTVKLLRFHSHIIHINDIDSFFKCFRCPSCGTFFNKSDNFTKHPLRCKTYLPKERLWASRNLVWKARRIHSSSFWKRQAFQYSSNFRFWVDLCSSISSKLIECDWWSFCTTRIQRTRDVGWTK